jgi:hypothetical protein
MSAATLTHALADLRRLAGTLIAAEIARRAAALREAEKIAATVAAECTRTREMLDAFREAQEQELAAVLAETAALAAPPGEKDEKTQPKLEAPRPTPIGSHPYAPSLPVLPETEQPAPRPESPPTPEDEPDLPAHDEGDPVAAEQEHWANGWEPSAEPEPLSDTEAKEAYAAAVPVPLSPERISEIVEAAVNGRLAPAAATSANGKRKRKRGA